MYYLPTDWKIGDIVTAEKLNNIEDYLVDVAHRVPIALIGNTFEIVSYANGVYKLKCTLEAPNIPLNPETLDYTIEEGYTVGLRYPIPEIATGNVVRVTTNFVSDIINMRVLTNYYPIMKNIDFNITKLNDIVVMYDFDSEEFYLTMDLVTSNQQ